MEINVFRRYEKKFLLTEDQYTRLVPIVREHMDLDPFCVDGKPYHVQTIYFDTLDNAIVRHSLDKPKFKEKLRLRHYGEVYQDGDPLYLEMKRKFVGVGTKRRVKLTFEEAQQVMHKQTLPPKEDYFSRQILGEIAYHINKFDVKPIVFISYSRFAYVARDDSHFRLTIDHDLVTRRNNLDFVSNNEGLKLIKPGFHLMEVKVGKAMPLWFARALSAYNIYSTSFSKYGKEFEHRLQKELAIDEYI
jgi:hypothetical protein